MITAAEAVSIVTTFDPAADGLARKSQELVLGLLTQSPAPYSRDQFAPGHITCTALVFHPSAPLVLMMHHHRLQRWLLPGGHVESTDLSLHSAAAREAEEETCVQLDGAVAPRLAGIDVHGIPAKHAEPYHLHHDLIWAFRARSGAIEVTSEAPEVIWAAEADFDRLQIADSIRLAIRRAGTLP
jgi:8-oxo-dGTP pyrophosphatase MutT (NUDIX family)